MTWRAGAAVIDGPEGRACPRAADPFDLLASLIERRPCLTAAPWPFHGGALGWFSYDAGRSLERLPATARDDRELPEMDFGLYAWTVAWDHARRRWAVIATGAISDDPAEASRAAAADADRIAAWAIAAAAPPHADRDTAGRPTDARPQASLDAERYMAGVQSIRDRIAEGDCYEVNLSRRIRATCDADPRRLFAALARRSPAPFAAYLEGEACVLAGSSPERFLRVSDRLAESRPIKGTAPRDRDVDLDRRSAEALAASAKDRAENVMIVDLVRNDLGRVCEPGSIEVPVLCGLESYASVHHLVSTVRGRLARGVSALDAARALFPPGSMTGAPKIRAMEVIESIEPTRRGPYSGAAGYVSASGEMDLSVVIRTLVLTPGRADVHSGGAVVSDSDPAAELGEVALKERHPLMALEEAMEPQRVAAG